MKTQNQVTTLANKVGSEVCTYVNSVLNASHGIVLSGDLCFSNQGRYSYVYERSRDALTRDLVNHPFHTQTRIIDRKAGRDIGTTIDGFYDCGKIRFKFASLLEPATDLYFTFLNVYSSRRESLEIVSITQIVLFARTYDYAHDKHLWILSSVGDLIVERR
jgi:hypothetical protein